MLHGLPEADSRVEADALLVDPGSRREVEPLLEERLHVGYDVVVARIVLHRPRLAEHVHEAEADIGIGHDSRQLGIAPESGDVVHEHRPGRDRAARHLRL